MTVTATNRKNSFTTNGSTVDFPFTFAVNDASQVKAITIDDDGVETPYINFTVVLNESIEGGVLTTNETLNNVDLLVYRMTSITQQVDYINGGRFPADSHESALDLLTQQNQEQQEELDRTLKAQISLQNPPELGELEEGKLLTVTGNVIVAAEVTEQDLIDAETSANTAADRANTAAEAAENIDLLAIARANNVDFENTAFLSLAIVTNINYLYEVSSQTTYYSPVAITGTISDTGTDIDGIRTITVDAIPYVIYDISSVNYKKIDNNQFTDFIFDTVQDMIDGLVGSETMEHIVGAKYTTKGFYSIGDGGGASYDIESGTGEGMYGDIQLSGAYIARLRPEQNSYGCFANFLQFGAVNDGVTNNDDMWAGVILWYARTGLPIFLNAGTYDFTVRTQFGGVPVYCEDGVVFTGEVQDVVDTIDVIGGKFTKTKTSADFWTFTYYRDPEFGDKGSMITAGDLITSTSRIVDVTGMDIEYTSWPTIASWQPYVSLNGISVDAESITFTDDNLGSSSYFAAFEPLSNDETISFAFFQDNGLAQTNGIFIRSANYYVSYVIGANYTNITKNVVDIAGATTTTKTVLNEVDSGDAGAYHFDKAVIEVRKFNNSGYSVAINGMLLDLTNQMPGGETIIDVGCGAYKRGNSNIFSVRYPTITTNHTPFIPRPSKIFIGGDSITTPAVRGWPLHFTEIMKGSLGCQIELVTNTAISGYTTNSVLNAVLATDLSGYNLGLILCGTNDIIAQNVPSIVKTRYESIIAEFVAYDIPLIFAVPPTYYSKTDAQKYGGSGGNPQNSAKGSIYRDLVKRVVAEARGAGARVYCLDLLHELPPSLARFLASSGDGNRVDTVLYDDLHPTQLARRWIGLAFAKRALSIITGTPQN